MGAWGSGTFDNDTACDWAYKLEETSDLSLVKETVPKALAPGNKVDVSVAEEALAACEVLARLQGNWGTRNSYTETVDKWVKVHPTRPPGALIQEALEAIDRIVSPPSEMLEVWFEAEKKNEWLAAVASLRERVASSPAQTRPSGNLTRNKA
jgi:hypothetical protein